MEKSKPSFKLGYWNGKNIKYMATSHIKGAISWLAPKVNIYDFNKDIKLLELNTELRLRDIKKYLSK